jgi:hypothetical protein
MYDPNLYILTEIIKYLYKFGAAFFTFFQEKGKNTTSVILKTHLLNIDIIRKIILNLFTYLHNQQNTD